MFVKMSDDQTIEELRKDFEKIDVDGNFVVSAEDLEEAANKCSLNLTKQQSRDIVK